MSGCPSSCAQHFTADIGLKGVRVRRMIGTREGFDVYLGGGIAGQEHMALPYKLGVDVHQLPTLVEDVVSEYYLLHKPGQTFSAYWRDKLQSAEADKVGDDEYQPPVWLCEGCQHRHVGEDPPVFCPSCAGLRRYFARLDEESTSSPTDKPTQQAPPARSDGFVFAAKLEKLASAGSLTAEVQGREYALFDLDGKVACTDAACPHEGAPLAEGDVSGGVVTCPWHQWEFDVCTGCSVSPKGHDLKSYATLVEDGDVFIKTGVGPTSADTDDAAPATILKAATVSLKVLDVISETPNVRTFRLDNSRTSLPQDFPGKFVQVHIPHDEGELWRSFTISSSPTNPKHVELTIKLNPDGIATRHLFDKIEPGTSLRIKGALGGFCFDPDRHSEPLVLISAGSGITPMMAISRFLKDTGRTNPCTMLYGARTQADIIFHDECRKLAAEHAGFQYVVSLTQPDSSWTGEVGRIDFERVKRFVPNLVACRYFLCGPNEFMDELRAALIDAGVPEERVHTEQFHAVTAPATV